MYNSTKLGIQQIILFVYIENLKMNLRNNLMNRNLQIMIVSARLTTINEVRKIL